MTEPENARRTALRIALLLGSLGLVLVVAELGARILAPFEPPVQIGKESLDTAENRAAFVGDPELFWRLRPGVRFPDDHEVFPGIVSNDQGLRSAREIAPEKAPNELRILFLGDSVTFGWGVRHEETFADRVERDLRRRFPQVETVSVNAGVPAYGLFQGWRFLEREGFDYQPDLVVLASFSFTDSLSWLNLSDFEQYERWQERQPPPALRWSALARVVAGALAPEHPPRRGARARLELHEFGQLLERVRDATREHDAELLVVVPCHENNVNGKVPPGTWGPHQTVLGEFGQQLRLGLAPGPALVDGPALLHRLDQQHELRELMTDKVHPTPRIHQALAEEIANAIAPWIAMQLEFGRFQAEG